MLLPLSSLPRSAPFCLPPAHPPACPPTQCAGKDAGRLAAAWALYKAQEQLVAICKENGIRLTLFHGRGGTVGRGGGPMQLAIQSQPPGSVEGSLRITEQGEMVQNKFGVPSVALRQLELFTNAVLLATLQVQGGGCMLVCGGAGGQVRCWWVGWGSVCSAASSMHSAHAPPCCAASALLPCLCCCSQPPKPPQCDSWRELMEEMSTVSCEGE